MTIPRWFILVIFVVFLYLFLSVVDVSIEVDDLRQSKRNDVEAINHLLNYTSHNFSCLVSIEEMANSMGKGHEIVQKGRDIFELSNASFRVGFVNRRLNYIEIVNIGRTSVCG